ncbi:hypothetical protein BMW22_27360 (plasmid) [Rhizobium leguminosarum]|uniref:Uncharacterized protein n=1 Tax=Rhizobium leguminosarum TaxID=384 RepID=A0A1B1CN62_RHILE|nr:hypothetical protein BA011_35480 [Rhizobium leguminosarum]API55268.1 hypothetical protein BMW22_27360 [Rhizobium leguminosarum]
MIYVTAEGAPIARQNASRQLSNAVIFAAMRFLTFDQCLPISSEMSSNPAASTKVHALRVAS